MKTYDNINTYTHHAKLRDIIVLGAKESKHDTYKIVSLNPLRSKQFRGKSTIRLSAFARNNKIEVLSKEEFNNLKVLW